MAASPERVAKLLAGQVDGDLTSLTLFDFSDRELLLIVDEQAQAADSGFATTVDIAEALGITGEHRFQCVGSRLSALKRFGAVEKDANSAQSKWAVTPMGKIMASGQIKNTAQKTLDTLGPEALILLTRFVTNRARVANTPAKLVQREFRRGLS
jgi:hypothetical protein